MCAFGCGCVCVCVLSCVSQTSTWEWRGNKIRVGKAGDVENSNAPAIVMVPEHACICVLSE